MKYTFILLAIALTQSVYAGTQLGEQKINSLANGWSGSHLYIATDKSLYAENCSVTDRRIILEDNHHQFNTLTSMLLSALHAKSNVLLYIDGCGVNNYMKLMSVKVVTN
ncbi:MAG: hypothetical protein KZQ85_10875 [Candidatus Thiodiazotropha sp. (ex Myrtea sp. 'scaly one' KF741663)]|nr:hypothetical protein [Candidatus Thiodiazotropha sp. (ex Myrtea sp. 'scaly one' KF741663)]